MERIHCDSCGEPKFHQTKDFYDKLINDDSIKCLSCGKVTLLPKENTDEPK